MRQNFFRAINRIIPNPAAKAKTDEVASTPRVLNIPGLVGVDPQAVRRASAQADFHKDVFTTPPVSDSRRAFAQTQLSQQRVSAVAWSAIGATSTYPELAKASGHSPDDLGALLALYDAMDRGERAYGELATEANDCQNALGAMAFAVHQASVEYRADLIRRGALSQDQHDDLAEAFSGMDLAAIADVQARLAKTKATLSDNASAASTTADTAAQSLADEVVHRLQAGETVDPQDLIAAYQTLTAQHEEAMSQVTEQLTAIKARKQPR